MKTLQEIQKENRKMILEAIHGCSYEEALQKEFNSWDCESIWNTNYGQVKLKGDPKYIGYNREKNHPDCFLVEILGKPLTLDRVLLALGKQKWWRFAYPLVLGFDGAFCEVWHSEMGVHFSEKFGWDLTKQTLEEQSEETQILLWKLIGGGCFE